LIKRGLFIVLMWASFAMAAFGQHTTVSSTVTDAGGQIWSYGTYKISFFSNGLGGPFFLNGAPFDPGTTFAGSLNSSGAFSGVSVPSSNFITPVGTAWFITVCPAATSACYTKTLPITGATMDLSSLVVPPALGVPANQYNQAAAYQDSEIKGPYLGFTYYNLLDMTLHVCTGSTACTWVSVSGGGGNPSFSAITSGTNNSATMFVGTGASLSVSGSGVLNASSIGGVQIPGPAFPGDCPIATSASSATWQSCTGGGGGSPAGTNGTLQATNGSSFIASNVNDNVQIPGALTVNESLDVCGPNPWLDITCYGADAVSLSSVPSTTATTTATSANVVVASGPNFPNLSGISILGAGPTNILATPATPTVTAAEAAVGMNTGDVVTGLVGSTTAQYEVVGRGIGQGITAASPAATLSTGAATLGPVITNVTGCTRTLATVACTTGSPSGVAVGAQLFYTNSTDATFSGTFHAFLVPDTLHFSYVGGIDTRGGVNVSTSSTGGTVTIQNANHVALPSSVVNVSGTSVAWVSGSTFNTGWPAGTWLSINGVCTTVASVTSTTALTVAASAGCPTLPATLNNSILGTAYQYYIYEYNGTNYAFVGISRPFETTWDDFGQPAPARPAWVPAIAPTVATNDTLSTTIVSGGGTSNLVLATAATQSVSGAAAVHDDGPAFVAAYQAATTTPTEGTVHVPTTATGTGFVINSYTNLGSISTTLLQQNPVTCNDTIATPGGATWTGFLGGGSPSLSGGFSWEGAQQLLVGTAFPCIAANSSSGNFNYLAFTAQNDNGLMMTVSPGGGFNFTVSNSSFSRAGTTDTVGMAIVGYGATKQSFSHDLFSINDTSTFGSYPTPMVYYRNDIPNLNGSGEATFEDVFIVGRGYENDSKPASGSFSHYVFKGGYCQACRMPAVTIGSLNGPSVDIDTFKNDTGSAAIVANLGANQLSVNMKNVPDNGGESGGGGIAGLLTGDVATGFTYTGNATSLGQNVNLTRFRTDVSIDALTSTPTAGALQYFDTMVRFGQNYSAFWSMQTATNVVTTVCPSGAGCGGSVPIGSWTYGVTAYDATGRSTGISTSIGSCVTTSTNQTCVTTWNAVPWAVSYSVARQSPPGSGYNIVVVCKNITALTCTDTASSAGGGSVPATGTAGSTVITANGMTKPGWYNAPDFPGSDFAVSINACVAAVNLNGGTCDATGFAGNWAATHGIVAGCATGCKGLLILPTNGTWTFTLTGGTSPMLLRYPDFAVWGTSSTNNLVFKNASADGGALAGYIEMGEGLSGGDYGLSGGFQIAQSSTTSVGYAAQTIDSVSYKVNCLLESGQDATVTSNVGCFDASAVDTNNILVIPPTAAEKPCCTRTIPNLVGNSLGTGPTVLEVYGSATVGSPNGVSFINPTMTHPKPGAYNIYLHDTNTTPTMAVDFGGATNFESATGNDQTTDEMLIDGAASITIQNIVCAANNTGGNRTGNCIHVTTTNPHTELFIGSAMSKSGAANWTYPMTMVQDDNNPSSPLTLSAAGISKHYDTTEFIQNSTIAGNLFMPISVSGNNLAIGTTTGACGTNLLCVGSGGIVMNSIGGALFPGALKFGTSITANTAGSHFNTTGTSNDIVGSIVITNPATSGSASFTTAYNSAPICTISPTSDSTGTVGFSWPSTSTTQVTVNVHTTPSSTATFFYHCAGHPN
jgi:hypothetical protein